MEIHQIQPFKGKNIYSLKPVIKAVVSLGELYDTPTKDIDMFNERLLTMLPGLANHVCGVGYEGGFGDRLREGTYLTHVTEHMVLELQSIMGYQVNYGKSRVTEDPTVYYMVFEYRNEKFAIECLLTAVNMVNSLIEGKLPDFGRVFHELSRMAAESDLGTSTGAIYAEAIKRNIPVHCLEHSSILQLGTGKYTRYLEASLTDSSGCVSVDLAGNKHLTKRILSEAGIPVPYGDIAYTPGSAAAIANCLGYPVVVKPYDANQGKGVFTNIRELKELEDAFRTAVQYSRAVIVEKYIPGKDYRLLVIDGKLVAAAERKPPVVNGDGSSTIKQLVEIENRNPLRGSDHEKPLTYIKIDEMSKQVLAKYGYDENSIPSMGDRVLLRYNGNLSTGGTARDCTEEVHPGIADLAVKAAELMNLDVAGIDITCEDISQPLTPQNGALIEVNAAPGLRMHIYPTEGTPRNVAGDILDMLYPAGSPCNIPIVSVTGTNGKTTVTRMIAHTLGLAGKVTGMTSTSGIYVGGECVLKGDNTGALSAARVLRDQRVEAAVLETARGGIIKRGLGYDAADVGVITNISEDHLGLDGINTLEDLAKVKALVIEAVKPEGHAVLNADDGMTPWLLQRIVCKPFLFSRDSNNPLIKKEIEKGNRVVYKKEDSIYSYNEGRETFIAKVDEIPITFGGKASCNIENSLAAAASLLALGISKAAIRKGITDFRPDVGSNPGRFNQFDMGGFTVMLDYGHNPAGYRAVADLMSSIDASGRTGIIGMPGDRMNGSIQEVGRFCGKAFDKIYIKEDNDLRGRDAGEVADLLYDSVISVGLDTGKVSVIYSEEKALETAIMDAKQGELVVMFYEDLESALKVIEKCKVTLSQRADKEKPEAQVLQESAVG
ncbi:MAG TPA: cyanophycin synthetase [Clostridia bacterium]|nr:cyanophycin synthetase [Clostridia bacterium]